MLAAFISGTIDRQITYALIKSDSLFSNKHLIFIGTNMTFPYPIFRSIRNSLPQLDIGIYTVKTDRLVEWVETIKDKIPIDAFGRQFEYIYCVDSDSYNLHIGDCQTPSIRTETCSLVDEETFIKKVEEAISDLYMLL